MVRHVSPHGLTVLLVESAQDDREMYAEYLRVSGLRPVEVGDTADAIRRAARADVIVTGIRVAGPFDGIELVRRLRMTPTTRLKPIIVLTACALDRDRRAAEGAGCDVYLTKPCLPDDLLREVERLAQSTRAARPVDSRQLAEIEAHPLRAHLPKRSA
jgi:two-component system cell cycle response regulator DivK